jgi:hypothetical protein
MHLLAYFTAQNASKSAQYLTQMDLLSDLSEQRYVFPSWTAAVHSGPCTEQVKLTAWMKKNAVT